MGEPSASGLKRFRTGTHRTASPDETWQRVSPLMPVVGVTRIANITGLDTIGIPVVMVARPNGKSLSVAQGKGLTLMAAKVSGLMEAIEAHHAEHITLPLKLATANELQFNHSLIDLSALPRYSTARFDNDQRILWIEGRDLINQHRTWLPFEAVHLDFTLPMPSGSGTFLAGSNGLASGNHVLEATSHALCELIERDAASLWRLRSENSRRATLVNLDSVDDPSCRNLIELFERHDISVSVWDVTSDVGIASFKCVIVDNQPDVQRPIRPMGGMGCHPTRAIALLRAMTEAAQSRATLVAGARDDAVAQRLDFQHYLDAHRRFFQHRALGGSLRHFGDIPSHEHDGFEEEVHWLLAHLQAVGIAEVVVVDLTKPQFGVPVVRLVVPGLEPHHAVAGYVPGPRARALLAQRVEASA